MRSIRRITQYLIEEKNMAVSRNRKTTTQKKAEQLSQQIIGNTRSNQKAIYDFCKHKYFKDLGYDSLKDWAKANREQLGRSYDSINNDYHTASITADMCGEEHIGKYAPHSLLQMKKLSREEREELFEHAQEELGEEELDDTDLTHANIKKFMVDLDFIDDEQKENDNNLKKSKSENKFHSVLSKTKSKYFAERIAIAINETTTQKNSLMICKTILVQHKNKRAVALISKMISDLND